MNDRHDRDLDALFDELKSEDRSAVPDFDVMMERARAESPAPPSVDSRLKDGGRISALWRALPAGAVLAAAGIGAIALTGAPSEAETDFQQAVAWLDSDPVFGSLASASDVLLETPGLSLLGAGSSSLSGLTDMLTVPASLGGSTERNES